MIHDDLLRKLRAQLSSNGALILRSSGAATSQIGGEFYSFGIEEEYFLVDSETLQVAVTTPDELFEAANWSTGGQAMREMLQSQIEVVTNVHADVNDAREELRFLRQQASAAAGEYGYKIMACGTHPSAVWRDSKLSPKARYIDMIEDLQQVGKRNMLCGMHVHVQIPDRGRRMDVLSAMIPYIPLFIALSASSPFWNSHPTGLKGYRLAAYDELPRTGIPPLFHSPEDYETYVQALKMSGVIPDETHLWWTLRPSFRHPTLELRAPDCCTSIDDAIAIASLYRALVRHLANRETVVTEVDRTIAIENKWRAQRYGTACSFVTRDGLIGLNEFLADTIEKLADDSAALGCENEVEHCRDIVKLGSSADHQLRIFNGGEGAALNDVEKWLAEATVA